MRRVSRMLLAGAMMLVPMLFADRAMAGQEAAQQPAAEQQRGPALTFDGEVVLWTVGVHANRTRDFEQIMNRLKDVLLKSETPERRRQAQGWKLLRGATNPETGQVMYVHLINNVRGADYNILELLYEAVDDHEEKVRIYDTFREALGTNFGATTWQTAIDLSR